MKKLLLIYFVATSYVSGLHAQSLSTFLETDSYGCYGLTISEDYLYVASSFNGKLFRKVVGATGNNYETFDIGGSGYRGICKAGNFIYIAKPANGSPGIYRYNLNGENSLESFVSLNHTCGLASRNSELYVSAANKIYMIDLNSSTPSLIQVADNVSGTSGFNGSTMGLKIYDDFLFVSDANGISKINLNTGNYEAEVVTNYTGSSFAKGSDNIFYLTNDNSVFELNSEAQTYSLLVTIDNFIGTYDIVFNDNSLFVTTLEGDYNKVAQIDLVSLSVQTSNIDKTLLFPNPANEYLNLTGFDLPSNITIITPNGQIVKSIKTENGKVDISDLETGVYFIRSENVYKKFIKK